MAAENHSFFSPSKGELDFPTVIQEIALFIATSPDSQHKIIIGTDSQVKKNQLGPFVDYVTAIVIHRLGFGGRYFWQRQRQYARRIFLRDRIYKEVTLSLDLASYFVPTLRSTLDSSRYELEIHIDVGNSGPTKDLIREVVGMVTGNGFTAKTKPQSFGASSVADRHT